LLLAPEESGNVTSRTARTGTFLPPSPNREEPWRVTPQLALRVAVLGSLALVVFAALFLRLWALEILSGQQYLRVAQNNQLRKIRIEAPRGAILDRNGRRLVDNRATTAAQLWSADLPKTWPAERRELRALSRILQVPVGQILNEMKKRAGDPVTPVTVKTGISEAQVRYLYEHKDDFPGLRIANSFVRSYPHGTLASQLLGYVTEISPWQLKHSTDGVQAGDKIGQAGVESAFDGYLRGVPGQQTLRVDSLGVPHGEFKPTLNPRPGSPIRLTIDVNLQRAAEDALQFGIQTARNSECIGCWNADGGAIVALDPNDGSVLAMASSPTFNPAVYSGRVTTQKLAAQGLTSSTAKARNYPALDRALQVGYPPGSTFKPVTALAALEEHLITPYSTLPCTGLYYSPHDRSHQPFKNWDPFVSQQMNLPTALAASCDTYFYQLGDQFYSRPAEEGHPLQLWASRFGFGQPTGIDVGSETDGLLPTPEWRLRTFTKRTDPCCWRVDRLWKPGDSIQLAIGQKDLLVTPLQMARFYALIANGGRLVTPHLLLSVDQPGGAAPHPAAPQPQKIDIDPNALSVVRQGLDWATHESFGTSSAVFGSFPVSISGKTGTAEKVLDPGDGIPRTFDQSWWCGYGPSDQARLVVCAVIENGGHGGTAAAPAALKVFEQYFHKEAAVQGPIHSD
jgi:penicillin-binding protein 2